VCLRLQRSRATVKALHSRLQHASQRDDVRLVRRTTGLIALLAPPIPVEVLRAHWVLSIACIYHWRQDCLPQGLAS
jgi:hypothetical protein